jgi:hypothetical protein
MIMPEAQQVRLEQVCDHLIDRDDYFTLDTHELDDFLSWMEVNYHNYTDIDGLDIDQMFDAWLGQRNLRVA